MSEPQSAYIALCKEAKLERRDWEYGDRYVGRWQYEGGVWSDWSGPDMCNDDGGGFPATGPDFEIVWLPRLDQLLDLLGAHGSITLLSLGTQASHGWICRFGNRDNNGAAGQTAEEAALYLLLSVDPPKETHG